MPSISIVHTHTHIIHTIYYLYYTSILCAEKEHIMHIIYYYTLIDLLFSLSVSPWLCNFRSLLYIGKLKKKSTYACTYRYDDVLGKTGYFAQLMSGKTEYYCDRYMGVRIKLCNFFFVSFVVLFIFSHTLGIRSSRIIINVGHLETLLRLLQYNTTTTTAAVVAIYIYITYTGGTAKVGVIVSESNGRISWCPLASNCEISGIH